MTVTIPAMALAAMVGSGCPVNQANMNQYSQVMNNPGSAQPYIQMQNGGASLDALLRQMGVSCPGGICDGLDSNCPTGSCGAGLDGSCFTGGNNCAGQGNSCGLQGSGTGCGSRNYSGIYR